MKQRQKSTVIQSCRAACDGFPRWSGLALLALALSGCNTTPVRDPEFAASLPAPLEVPQARQAASGAIFQSGYDVVLFEDSRARRIGDILTIRLIEVTNASKSQSNDISRDSATDIANPTILGANPAFALPGLLPLVATAASGNNKPEIIKKIKKKEEERLK